MADGGRTRDTQAPLSSAAVARLSSSETLSNQPARYRRLEPAPRVKRPIEVRARNSAHRLVRARQCRVRQCVATTCNLRSHREYVPIKVGSSKMSISNNQPRTPSAQWERGSRELTSTAELADPLVDISLSALPALPVKDIPQPVIQRLLRQFFTCYYDRIISIVKCPPINTVQERGVVADKHESLTTALSAPVFSLHYAAAAHHQLVFRRDAQCPDQTTAALQMNLLKLLRDKLDNFTHQEVKEVAVVILTLVMLTTATGDLAALPFHRQAVCHLVDSQGGLHNMGRSTPFVVTLDRVISMFTDRPPCFVQIVDRAIRRPTQWQHRYGSSFESPRFIENSIDRDVVDFGFDVCRAIELLENKNVSFTQDGTSAPFDDRIGTPSSAKSYMSGSNLNLSESTRPDLGYLYFLKDSLSTTFVHLNAKFAPHWVFACSQAAEEESLSDSRSPNSPCILSYAILVTAFIVDYVALQDGYMVSITLHFANRLRDILTCRVGKERNAHQAPVDRVTICDGPELSGHQKQDSEVNSISPVLRRHPTILRWCLFVIASIPLSWEHHCWCTRILKRLLADEYAACTGQSKALDTLLYGKSGYHRPVVGSGLSSNDGIDRPHNTTPHSQLWLDSWRKTELHNLQSFVWSNTRLNRGFTNCCDEIEGMQRRV